MMRHVAFFGLLTAFLCVVSPARAQRADCPTISVIGPPDITVPNDNTIFEVKSSKSLPPEARFEWTVSDGTILEGQGTKSIKIKVPGSRESTKVTATVYVQGLPQGCVSTASETAAVASLIVDPIIDSYGKLSLNDEKARMVNIGHRLKVSLQSKALILKYVPKVTSAVHLRITQLTEFLVHYLGIPRNRFEFVVRIKPQTETMITLPPMGFKYKD